MVELTPELIRQVCLHCQNVDDVIHFSMVNKSHYESINTNADLWIRYLKLVNVWGTDGDRDVSNERGIKLNVVNCLKYKVTDKSIARERFIEIWTLLSPIIKELLIKDYNNFQSLTIFQKHSNPLTQASLLTNINRVLPLYQNSPEYKTMIVKFDTLINMFINSIITEVSKRLKQKDYDVIRTLLKSLDLLQLNSDKIDPLESLVEFFYERYSEDYSFMLRNDQVDQFFMRANIKKRGVVNGSEFKFENVDLFFEKISIIVNKHLEEINEIYHSKDLKNDDMDEIPIVLKLMEHFLSNYLVGGIIDRIILRSKEIDSMDDFEFNNVGIEENEKNEEEGEEETENSRINIMNEGSLFFQCVPYIHLKLIATVKDLKYPKTVILLDDGSNSNMDYVRVCCQLINYCFENYLIEFTDELPLKCKASLYQLIDSWDSQNAQTQRNIEHEIMKNVENETKNETKFNMEIFSTFTNMFNFKKNSKEVKEEEDENKEIKISKVAAKLKILITKVETIKSLISIDLVILLLQHIKNSYDLLIGLTNYSITEQLRKQINQSCINIFNDMLIILINKHIKAGFNEALNRLKKFDPLLVKEQMKEEEKEPNDNKIITLEPLTNFIELVDVGDLILQMVGIFYERELVNSGIVKVRNQHTRDFLKMNVIEKSIKLLESSLDTYVANGLDISIGIIINEIQTRIEQDIGPIPSVSTIANSKASQHRSKHARGKNVVYGAKYPPPSTAASTSSVVTTSTLSTATTTTLSPIATASNEANNRVYDLADMGHLMMNEGKALAWIASVIEIMGSHFTLLQNSIEKNIMEVFKQEIGDRFITLLIQLLMKKFVISTVGAVQFSFDINTLYDFYQAERIKPAIEYLKGFKRVDQIYFVECQGDRARTADLARMIIDVGRDNGVFTPDEVYQFSTRRSDWGLIKRRVDNVVYGFGAEDCAIM